MKKKIFAALAASVMLCGLLTAPAAADTAAAEEKKTAVTQPVSSDEIREKELFGLSVDASAFTLNVGETRELKVSLNTDYYLADSLHFYSDDQSVAWVYPYIGGHVIGTSAGTAAIQVSARLDKNKVILSPEDNGERSVTVKVTVTEPTLSESQKAALKRLEEAEQNGRGFYLRERAVITGAISADAPRLTLDEVNRIVDPSQPCEKVWKALMDAQIYPDYYDTGDPTSLVYWLDNRGQEVIGIQDFSMIHYSRTDETGVLLEVQYLYPEPSHGTAGAEDSLNISEEIKDHFRVYEIYSDAETKPERRLVQDFKSIMRIYNTSPRFAFTAYNNIDDILASNLVPAKYYVVEDAAGELKFYNEEYTEMISTRYAEVGGSRKQLPYVDLPAKALERFRNPDFAKTYISPDAEVENVYWLSGESSMMGTAIYYRTSAGDYVYYNYYAIGEALFPVEMFCAYQQAITDEIAKYPESGGGINIADVWDLSAYQLKELSSAKPGDANCDGSIDVSDAVLIARFAAEDREATMTDQGRQNADVTHDGNVDGQDSTKILQYIAKKISLEDLVK